MGLIRREREPWSRKTLVEDCLRFDISKLTRDGVFRADPGTLSSSVWSHQSGREVYRVYLWLETTNNDQSVLCVETDVRAAVSRQLSSRGQAIPIVQARLYFGPRRYFLCPGVRDNIPCGRRVRILYLPSNAGRLGCRACHHLIHRSAQQHDKRLDALMRLTPEGMAQVLLDPNPRRSLLGVKAMDLMRARLMKRLQRGL